MRFCDLNSMDSLIGGDLLRIIPPSQCMEWMFNRKASCFALSRTVSLLSNVQGIKKEGSSKL